MTGAGITHFILMIGALALGAVILAMPKGTPGHVRWGRVFMFGMLASNVIVLFIYEDADGPGIFHLLAIISLASLITAVSLVRLPKRDRRQRIVHGHIMLVSYGGVVAAGLGQGAVAFDLPPWPVILACILVVVIFSFRLNLSAMVKGR